MRCILLGRDGAIRVENFSEAPPALEVIVPPDLTRMVESDLNQQPRLPERRRFYLTGRGRSASLYEEL